MVETTTSLEVENVIMEENATSWSKMQDEGRKNLMLSRQKILHQSRKCNIKVKNVTTISVQKKN